MIKIFEKPRPVLVVDVTKERKSISDALSSTFPNKFAPNHPQKTSDPYFHRHLFKIRSLKRSSAFTFPEGHVIHIIFKNNNKYSRKKLRKTRKINIDIIA